MLEGLIVLGALALVGGLKFWMTWRRLKGARPMKEPPPPADGGEAPPQRR